MGFDAINSVSKASVDIGTQTRLNYIAGANIAIDIVDDPVNGEIDILINNPTATVGDETADNLFRVVGNVDSSKKLAFEVDGLTSATTRTVTIPDKDGTMAMLSDVGGGGPDIWDLTSNVVSNTGANSIVGTDSLVFGSSSLDDTGDTSEDKRIQFSKALFSFRGGSANGTEFDIANNGIGSFGYGDRVIASGTFTIALQNRTEATGNQAMVWGSNVRSSALLSTACGFQYENDQDYSLTIGRGSAITDTTPSSLIRLEADPDQIGSAKSSIYIEDSSSAPISTTNRLYTVGGNLFWNGTQLN